MKRTTLLSVLVIAAWALSGLLHANAGVFDWLEELADPGIKSVSPGDREKFRQRADEGDPEAHLALGIIYEKGLGLLQSWGAAHRHFNLASALSPMGPSGESLRTTAKRRMGRLEERMTPAQIGEAQSDAEKWMASFERKRQAETLAKQVRAAAEGFWQGLKTGK